MLCLFVLFAAMATLAQTNPVPWVNQPLVPTAIAPGGAGFTLTVNGTGFVSGSVVNWNGTALGTTFVSSSQLMATVPASDIAAASTASITVSSPSPGGGNSNVLFFAVSAPTNLQFTSFSGSPNFGDPFSGPLVADFNRDGKLDFVVSTTQQLNEQPTPNVFLGNGDGSFQPSKNIDQALETLAVCDFNGDGIPDLAGTSYNTQNFTGTLSILSGNGDGTFTGGSAYALPAIASSLMTADFNGDGKLDVAVADGSAGVYVFLGNGDGTFQSPVISNINNLNLAGAVGDFNGDGKLDFIGIEGLQLGWFKGNGDGTFQPPSTFYSVGANSDSVLAADLNRDGKLDLITVQESADTYTVMLGNGDGTFQTGVVYSVGSPVSNELAMGDLNADGHLDLVLTGATNQLGTSILLGNGNGTFQSPLELPIAGTFAIGEAGDFNNDGKLDLIAINSFGALATLLQDVPQAGLSPSSLTFQQLVGTTSPRQNVTLTNSGAALMTLSGITIMGQDAADFSQTNNCLASLAVGANCQISVTFTPPTAATFNASLAVTDNALGSPQSVPLSGTGTTPPPIPYLSPANVTFPNQYVGTSGLPQTVMLNNPESSPLAITSVTATPADFAPLSTCGNMIAPGGSCSIGVFFDPTTSGTRNGTLTVTDNATNSPQTASLTGTGQDFSLAAGAQTTATVTPGQTATYMISVAPGGGFKQTVSLSCSGAPAHSTCSVSPSSIALGSSASTVTVTVSTAGSSAVLTLPFGRPPYGGATAWLARSGTVCGFAGMAIVISFAGWRRQRRQGLVHALALFCLLSIGVTLSACGGGGSSNSGGGGTQPGTYNLTVAGSFTSGSTTLTHSIKLTLVVQ
jgi:hypothetical protein